MKTSAFCCALILSAGNMLCRAKHSQVFTPRFFVCMLHQKLNRFETGLPHARFCFEIRCL